MSEWTYHDALAQFGIGSAHPGGYGLTKELLAKEALTAKTRVLDCGCGTGRTAALLAKRYLCKVTALDRHPLMLEKAKRRMAKEKVSRVRLMQGDIENLPFADNSFDLLLAESVTVFTDLGTALREYARVLRPGGVLIDLDMTAERPLSARELEELRLVYGTRHVPTEAEWRGRLEQAGFDRIEVVKGGSVASALTAMTEQQAADAQDIDPSEGIDPRLYEIFAAHERVTRQYRHRLGFRVFRAVVR